MKDRERCKKIEKLFRKDFKKVFGSDPKIHVWGLDYYNLPKWAKKSVDFVANTVGDIVLVTAPYYKDKSGKTRIEIYGDERANSAVSLLYTRIFKDRKDKNLKVERGQCLACTSNDGKKSFLCDLEKQTQDEPFLYYTDRAKKIANEDFDKLYSESQEKLKQLVKERKERVKQERKEKKEENKKIREEKRKIKKEEVKKEKAKNDYYKQREKEIKKEVNEEFKEYEKKQKEEDKEIRKEEKLKEREKNKAEWQEYLKKQKEKEEQREEERREKIKSRKKAEKERENRKYDEYFEKMKEAAEENRRNRQKQSYKNENYSKYDDYDRNIGR